MGGGGGEVNWVVSHPLLGFNSQIQHSGNMPPGFCNPKVLVVLIFIILLTFFFSVTILHL